MFWGLRDRIRIFINMSGGGISLLAELISDVKSILIMFDCYFVLLAKEKMVTICHYFLRYFIIKTSSLKQIKDSLQNYKSNFLDIIISLEPLFQVVIIANLSKSIFMQSPNNIPKKNTIYDHFQGILGESSLIQHVAASLASSLQTSLMLLPQSKLNEISFTTQMKEVSEKITKMIDRIKNSIENEFQTINQVKNQLDKISDSLRKVIDLGRNQEQRSSFVLAQLSNQLKSKEAELKDCQSEFKRQAKKKEEEEWKQKYYVCRKKRINLIPDQLYIQLLKQQTEKIEAQIRFQKKQSEKLQNKVDRILTELKINLFTTWSQLFEKDNSIRSTKKITHDSNPEDRYTQLENNYVKKQKGIDLFDFQKFQHIKKKLRLLEQADMSEFHQYESYSICSSQNEENEQNEFERVVAF